LNVTVDEAAFAAVGESTGTIVDIKTVAKAKLKNRFLLLVVDTPTEFRDVFVRNLDISNKYLPKNFSTHRPKCQ
jgi:hypothetical protein